MGIYLCSGLAKSLQESKGVYITDKSDSSWTFEYNGAKLTARILPGCCGILLLYRISGKEKAALRLIKFACQAARKNNFGLVTLSLLASSPLVTLLGTEWQATGFLNPRTHNEVQLLSYKLPVKVKAKKVTFHEDN